MPEFEAWQEGRERATKLEHPVLGGLDSSEHGHQLVSVLQVHVVLTISTSEEDKTKQAHAGWDDTCRQRASGLGPELSGSHVNHSLFKIWQDTGLTLGHAACSPFTLSSTSASLQLSPSPRGASWCRQHGAPKPREGASTLVRLWDTLARAFHLESTSRSSSQKRSLGLAASLMGPVDPTDCLASVQRGSKADQSMGRTSSPYTHLVPLSTRGRHAHGGVQEPGHPQSSAPHQAGSEDSQGFRP